MSSTFRSASTAGPSTGVTVTIPKPTGVAARDMVYALIMSPISSSPTGVPTGWGFIRESIMSNSQLKRLRLYKKLATDSEPADYSWTWASGSGYAGILVDYYNVDDRSAHTESHDYSEPSDGVVRFGTFSNGTIGFGGEPGTDIRFLHAVFGRNYGGANTITLSWDANVTERARLELGTTEIIAVGDEVDADGNVPLRDDTFSAGGQTIGVAGIRAAVRLNHTFWFEGSSPSHTTYDTALSYETDGEMAWDGDRYLYVLGRGRNGTESGLFLRYDITTDAWNSSLAQPSFWRTFHASAVHGGKAYFFAGEKGLNGDAIGDDTWETTTYDIAGDSWGTAAPMPLYKLGDLDEDILAGTMSFKVTETITHTINPSFTIQIGDEVISISGRTLFSGSTYTYTVSARGHAGTTAAAHTTGDDVFSGYYRSGPSAITDGDYIYVIGGYGSGSNDSVDNRTDRYEPLLDQWTKVEDMPLGTNFTCIVPDGSGLIHSLGANIDPVGGVIRNAHQVFDPGTETWSYLEHIPTDDPLGRGTNQVFQGSAVYHPANDEIVLVIVQNTSSAPDYIVYRYSVALDSWSADSVDDLPGYLKTGIGDQTKGFTFGGRQLITTTEYGSLGSSPNIIYFDGTTPRIDLLSTVDTIDHDLVFGVHRDQHHAEAHALSDLSAHTGGYTYKSGASPTISDADVLAAGVLVVTDGMVAVTHDTTTGIDLLWMRMNGTWAAVEVAG